MTMPPDMVVSGLQALIKDSEIHLNRIRWQNAPELKLVLTAQIDLFQNAVRLIKENHP